MAEALRPATTRVGRPARVHGKNIAKFGHEMPAEMAAKLDTLADEIGTNRRSVINMICHLYLEKEKTSDV